MNNPRKINITPIRVSKVEYEEKRALFGLLKWFVRISSNTIGEELHITTTREPEKIYLNGMLLTKEQ